jgi:hypothetical protein
MKSAPKPVAADDERRVKPDSSGWLEAQRAMTERNDNARKAGKDARAQQENARATLKAKRERAQGVFR